MMISDAISSLLSLVRVGLERAIPDPVERQRVETEMQRHILANGQKQIEMMSNVVIAEAKGESWLQRNWRPMIMIWFSLLLGVHWFGWTPENISEDQIQGLYLLLQISIGGYIGGRTVEKTARIIKGEELPRAPNLIGKAVGKIRGTQQTHETFGQ